MRGGLIAESASRTFPLLSPLSSLFFKRCVAARTVVSGADCDEFLDGGMFPVMATALYGAAVTLSGKKVN